ncbi:MAG: division/cell wall cluster transcriptional repressor MraZ [Polyangiaceae bacterium]|nr:division/cell wall cluster transcriptional repressor MraZ [Polyangiaceae bacterium]
MFRGQFEQKIDAKGRISLPARFRQSAADGAPMRFVLAPALFDACLHLYPLAAWEELEKKISALPSMDPHVVRFRRLYISAACDCEADKAGRLLIPTHLRNKAHLDKQALWAGMGDHLELWSSEDWEANLALSPEQEEDFKRAVLEQIKI